jgi:cation transporter-like permease
MIASALKAIRETVSYLAAWFVFFVIQGQALTRLRSLLANSRELVILVPLSALLLWAALLGISALTGAPVLDSPVPLAEFAIALVRFTVCGAFATLFQASALGYRAEKSGGSLADDAFDASVFVVLFLMALVATSVF